jgi:hypothetical protein
MNPSEQIKIDSNALSDFSKIMQSASSISRAGEKSGAQNARIELDRDNVKNGLGQLVLTLVRLIHELLERQAIRRMDAGTLSDEEIEAVGLTLMKQTEEIERLRKEFGLEEDDLNLDLGPLGRLL